MKKIILTLIFALIFFSCEEPIETVSETFPILSLNSQTEDVSINEMITITIHIKNLSAPIFGAYLEIAMDNTKIEFIDSLGSQIGEFWNENSIIFERFEQGTLHLTMVNTENQSNEKTDGTMGEFSIKALSSGVTAIEFKIEECEFFDYQGENIEIQGLIFESINLNIN